MDITIGDPVRQTAAPIELKALAAGVVRQPISFSPTDRRPETGQPLPLYTRSADKVEAETALHRGRLIDVTG